MNKQRHTQGFTLIELLVVITIIAILASISVPVYNSITERAKITKAMSNVKQINLACRTFAIDNSGVFPTGNTADTGAGTGAGSGGNSSSSTVAFNELVPAYINVEAIFYTPGNSLQLKQIPDENGVLITAENCFAYVAGLTDSSPGNIPVIADWFTAGGTTYDENHPWWASRKAVVGRADGSASAERISSQGGFVLGADKQSNLFGTPSGGGAAGTTSGAGGLIPVNLTVVNP